MKWIEEPRKLVITVLVVIVLAVVALIWHSVKILPRDIQQAVEEEIGKKSGP